MQTKFVPETHVLAATRRLRIPEVAAFSAEACPALEASASEQGITFTGPWTFVSHNLPQDAVTKFRLQICRPIEPSVETPADGATALPPFECAVAEYEGPLSGIFASGYAPLLDAIAESGRAMSGEIREIYHTWSDPESEDNHVEIQIGLASA